jgi:hypothetical protein
MNSINSLFASVNIAFSPFFGPDSRLGERALLFLYTVYQMFARSAKAFPSKSNCNSGDNPVK